MARVIFDARANAHFQHHFQVIFRPHLETLGFQQFAAPLEPGDAFGQFLANGQRRAFDFVHGRDELFARINRNARQRFDSMAGQGIEPRDALNPVAEELDAQRVFGPGGAKLDGIAAHAKLAAGELEVVPAVLQVHDAFEELLARDFLPGADRDHHRFVILLAADAVNARNTGDDHDVAPRKQRTHRGQTQPLDFLVAARILLDERVRAGDVSFGLVVIEVTDEIFDRVVGKEAFELGVKLRGQCFVVRNDQRRFADVFDDVRDGERLARPRHTEQRLMLGARQNPLGQLRDGLRLIT